MTGPEFRDLADSAGDWVLVTFRARLSVVDWSESLGYVVPLFESFSVAIMCSLTNEGCIVG